MYDTSYIFNKFEKDFEKEIKQINIWDNMIKDTNLRANVIETFYKTENQLLNDIDKEFSALKKSFDSNIRDFSNEPTKIYILLDKACEVLLRVYSLNLDKNQNLNKNLQRIFSCINADLKAVLFPQVLKDSLDSIQKIKKETSQKKKDYIQLNSSYEILYNKNKKTKEEEDKMNKLKEEIERIKPEMEMIHSHEDKYNKDLHEVMNTHLSEVIGIIYKLFMRYKQIFTSILQEEADIAQLAITLINNQHKFYSDLEFQCSEEEEIKYLASLNKTHEIMHKLEDIPFPKIEELNKTYPDNASLEKCVDEIAKQTLHTSGEIDFYAVAYGDFVQIKKLLFKKFKSIFPGLKKPLAKFNKEKALLLQSFNTNSFQNSYGAEFDNIWNTITEVIKDNSLYANQQNIDGVYDSLSQIIKKYKKESEQFASAWDNYTRDLYAHKSILSRLTMTKERLKHRAKPILNISVDTLNNSCDGKDRNTPTETDNVNSEEIQNYVQKIIEFLKKYNEVLVKSHKFLTNYKNTMLTEENNQNYHFVEKLKLTCNMKISHYENHIKKIETIESELEDLDLLSAVKIGFEKYFHDYNIPSTLVDKALNELYKSLSLKNKDKGISANKDDNNIITHTISLNKQDEKIDKEHENSLSREDNNPNINENFDITEKPIVFSNSENKTLIPKENFKNYFQTRGRTDSKSNNEVNTSKSSDNLKSLQKKNKHTTEEGSNSELNVKRGKNYNSDKDLHYKNMNSVRYNNSNNLKPSYNPLAKYLKQDNPINMCEEKKISNTLFDRLKMNAQKSNVTTMIKKNSSEDLNQRHNKIKEKMLSSKSNTFKVANSLDKKKKISSNKLNVDFNFSLYNNEVILDKFNCKAFDNIQYPTKDTIIESVKDEDNLNFGYLYITNIRIIFASFHSEKRIVSIFLTNLIDFDKKLSTNGLSYDLILQYRNENNTNFTKKNSNIRTINIDKINNNKGLRSNNDYFNAISNSKSNSFLMKETKRTILLKGFLEINYFIQLTKYIKLINDVIETVNPNLTPIFSKILHDIYEKDDHILIFIDKLIINIINCLDLNSNKLEEILNNTSKLHNNNENNKAVNKEINYVKVGDLLIKIDELSNQRNRDFRNHGLVKSSGYFKFSMISNQLISNSPVFIIFNYLFNPNINCLELNKDKCFFEGVLEKQGHKNIKLINIEINKTGQEVDNLESQHIDLEHLMNYFSRYTFCQSNFNEKLEEYIEEFSKNIFQITFTYNSEAEIKNNNINLKTVLTVNFISPILLIVEIVVSRKEGPYFDTYETISQLKFDCPIYIDDLYNRIYFKTEMTHSLQVNKLKKNIFMCTIESESLKQEKEFLNILLPNIIKILENRDVTYLTRMYEFSLLEEYSLLKDYSSKLKKILENPILNKLPKEFYNNIKDKKEFISDTKAIISVAKNTTNKQEAHIINKNEIVKEDKDKQLNCYENSSNDKEKVLLESSLVSSHKKESISKKHESKDSLNKFTAKFNSNTSNDKKFFSTNVMNTYSTNLHTGEGEERVFTTETQNYNSIDNIKYRSQDNLRIPSQPINDINSLKEGLQGKSKSDDNIYYSLQKNVNKESTSNNKGLIEINAIKDMTGENHNLPKIKNPEENSDSDQVFSTKTDPSKKYKLSDNTITDEIKNDGFSFNKKRDKIESFDKKNNSENLDISDKSSYTSKEEHHDKQNKFTFNLDKKHKNQYNKSVQFKNSDKQASSFHQSRNSSKNINNLFTNNENLINKIQAGFSELFVIGKEFYTKHYETSIIVITFAILSSYFLYSGISDVLDKFGLKKLPEFLTFVGVAYLIFKNANADK